MLKYKNEGFLNYELLATPSDRFSSNHSFDIRIVSGFSITFGLKV